MPLETTLFLSSTYNDLAAHRSLLIDTFQRIEPPIGLSAMEFFGADERSAIKLCQEKVTQCDFYVGLFGWRYGYVDKLTRMSITEVEYRTALAKDIPTLLYLLSEKYAVLPSGVDSGQKGAAIRRLRNEVQERHVVQFFTSPEDLSRRVATDLGNRLRDRSRIRPKPLGPVGPEINLEHPFMLCHVATPSRNPAYSNFTLYIDVYENSVRARKEMLKSINRVVYQLHKSFSTPIVAMQNWRDHFRLDGRVWGEFWVQATVFFNDSREPVILRRYLNLELPPSISRRR